MLGKLKQRWREFRRGRPGHRFQERYERNRPAQAGWTRFLKPFAAVALLVAGVVFCLIPGPGAPLLLIGAALLADVSLRVARALDRLELRVRDAISRARRWWRHASWMARSGAIMLAVTLGSGVVYGAFRILMERSG